MADGSEALAGLTAPDAPDLAILDWMMPGLDGVELCRRVRAEPALKSLYVILLTARGSQEHLIEVCVSDDLLHDGCVVWAEDRRDTCEGVVLLFGEQRVPHQLACDV